MAKERSGSFRPISSAISLGLIVVIVIMEIMGLKALKDNLPALNGKDLGGFLKAIAMLFPTAIFFIIATVASISCIRPASRAMGNLTPLLRILGIITFILNLIILIINVIIIYQLFSGNWEFFRWLSKFLFKIPLPNL